MIRTSLRQSGCGALCAAVLATLPEWFGLAESNAGCEADAEALPTWVARADGADAGLLILKTHFAATLEIHLLAVRRDRRGGGIGRALVEAAAAEARRDGRVMLTVKTRGPSIPYEPYEQTRAFYEACGFVPLEEFVEIWGPENPCLFMARPLLV
jgi:GNAT superfamily N-acetyltransferase